MLVVCWPCHDHVLLFCWTFFFLLFGKPASQNATWRPPVDISAWNMANMCWSPCPGQTLACWWVRWLPFLAKLQVWKDESAFAVVQNHLHSARSCLPSSKKYIHTHIYIYMTHDTTWGSAPVERSSEKEHVIRLTHTLRKNYVWQGTSRVANVVQRLRNDSAITVLFRAISKIYVLKKEPKRLAMSKEIHVSSKCSETTRFLSKPRPTEPKAKTHDW